MKINNLKLSKNIDHIEFKDRFFLFEKKNFLDKDIYTELKNNFPPIEIQLKSAPPSLGDPSALVIYPGIVFVLKGCFLFSCEITRGSAPSPRGATPKLEAFKKRAAFFLLPSAAASCALIALALSLLSIGLLGRRYIYTGIRVES